MSDAFRNYNNLISGLNQANQQKATEVIALAKQKANADEVGKTLGEVKSFIAGAHGSKSFVKDIKPILKKRAERLAERAKAELRKRAEGKLNEFKERINNARQNAQDRVQQARNDVEERFSGERESNLDQPNTQGENSLQQEEPVQNEQYDDWDTPYGGETNGGEQNDGYDDWDTPATTGADDFDEWDTNWGEDTINESRAGTFSNPIANSRANLQNPLVQDSQNPMVPRSSELPSYEESTADTAGSKLFRVNVFQDGQKVETNYLIGSEQPPPKYNPTGGEGDGALSNESQMANVKPSATGAGNAGSETEKVATKAVEKGVAKSAGEEAGDIAGEAAGETALGVLDAIPGLDILGFLGGAILTAVEAHKQRKEEREESEGAGATPVAAVQVGVGNE